MLGFTIAISIHWSCYSICRCTTSNWSCCFEVIFIVTLVHKMSLFYFQTQVQTIQVVSQNAKSIQSFLSRKHFPNFLKKIINKYKIFITPPFYKCRFSRAILNTNCPISDIRKDIKTKRKYKMKAYLHYQHISRRNITPFYIIFVYYILQFSTKYQNDMFIH